MADERENSYDEGDDYFPSEDDMQALMMERSYGGSHESNVDLTYRLFEENAPSAAMQIVKLAFHGSSERIRLDANKYIVERILGRIGDDTAANHALSIPDQIGEKVAEVIEGVLVDIQITEDQKAQAAQAVPKRLRALTSSQQSSASEE